MKTVIASLFAGVTFISYFAMAQTAPSTPNTSQSDNTRANKADQQRQQPTAQDQSQAKADRELAAGVRKAIVGEKSLSTYAHNVKVIAHAGTVTLRGPVRSDEEKSKVGELAQGVTNVQTVDNRVTVKNAKK